MTAADLSADRLREMLHYEPLTGVFTWRVTRCGRAIAGAAAGRVSGGYWKINVEGQTHAAHRLAWLYMTGARPVNVVDHIDTDRLNNRWVNLRDIPQTINLQNRHKARVDNRSAGLLGVSRYPINGKFQARIQVDGKSRSLGYFATPEEAHGAYVRAKRQFHEGCTL